MVENQSSIKEGQEEKTFIIEVPARELRIQHEGWKSTKDKGKLKREKES
jgi:hypothetical protein